MKVLLGKVINCMIHKIKLYRSAYYSSIINGKGIISGECEIQYGHNIFLGKGSFINGGSRIFASPNAQIIIGDNCMISYNCHLRTSYHNYLDKERIMINQGMKEASIVIGNDVWLGYGAQIMSGVKIGDGAVIGAGAVVCHDIEPYAVYGGVPARKIKDRM